MITANSSKMERLQDLAETIMECGNSTLGALALEKLLTMKAAGETTTMSIALAKQEIAKWDTEKARTCPATDQPCVEVCGTTTGSCQKRIRAFEGTDND